MIPESNLRKMMRVEEMVGEDEEDTALLEGMLKEALNYIQGFYWCPKIEEVYLGAGVGGVVAVFLFSFKEDIEDGVDCLWVIVGDLPSAYLVVENAPDPISAADGYCELMEDWIAAVLGQRPLDKDVFPVKASPTKEHADMLRIRIEELRDCIIPKWRKEWSNIEP